MIKKVSEIDYRLATLEEQEIVLKLSSRRLDEFLSGSAVVREDKNFFAVVGGVAYNLEKLANLTNTEK